jgi:hypothetical protein
LKTAYCNGYLLDLNATQKNIDQIRSIVKSHGANCMACRHPVIFCSGPVKGSYFAHQEKSEECEFYHPSSDTEYPEQISPVMKEAIGIFEEVLKRSLLGKEREHIYSWLYYEDYQVTEVKGALQELTIRDIPTDLFKKMDSKLYSITRKKNNPYFQRSAK